MLFSKSYQEDIILSLLVLIPFYIIKIIYIYHKNKKMGTSLISLRKTSSEERSNRSLAVITIVFVIFILVLTYFLSNNFRIGVPWLFLTIFNYFYESYIKNYLQKGLMEKGICTGNNLLEWDRIESFKWVIPKKTVDFGTLKIGYTKFYSYHIAYLSVVDEQKEEVYEIFHKMIKNCNI